MKKETITVYSCCFCRKISRNAGAMSRHEHFCRKNPRNHALCYDCKFYEESTEQRYAVGGGDMPEDCLLYKNECKKRSCYLYNSLRWRQDSIDYIKKYSSAFKPIPSVVEGCPFYEPIGESMVKPEDKMGSVKSGENVDVSALLADFHDSIK